MANLKFNPNKLSSVISGGASILDTSLDLAEINDNYQDDITQVRNQPFSPSGTYSLMNQFNNMNWGTNKTLHDFTGKTGADYAKGILGATATGAMAGKTFGPIGAAVGAGVGFLGSSIGAISNYINGNNALDHYRRELSDAREFALRNADLANNELKTNMFNDSLRTFYRSSAYGGELGTHGSDFSNNVKYINTGGTHEQNPNGGVLMGVDEQGTPNFVEEGEVIVGDYVFSNRMRPSQSALEKAHLDPSLHGGSYAEIAEAIAEKSEEMPNDPISKRTLNSNLSRLMSVQEDARARKAERENNEDANKFVSGGPMNKATYNQRKWEADKQAKQYANHYAQKRTDAYKQMYERKLAELMEPIEREWQDAEAQRARESEEWERKGVLHDYIKSQGLRSLSRNTADKTYDEYVSMGILKPMATQEDEAASLERELELQHPIPDNSAGTAATDSTSVTSSGEPVSASGQTATTVDVAENTSPASDQTPRGARRIISNGSRQNTSQLNEPITSWNDLVDRIGTYGVSRNRGNINGTYRIDNQFPLGQFKTIEDLEKSDEYVEFTEYIKNHPDDPNVQRYLKALDDGVADNVERLFDGNTLKSNWTDIYERRRNDQKGGIYHFSGNLSDILSNSERTPRYNLEPLNRDRLPGEPTLESVMGVKEPELLDRDRPRPNAYTGPNNANETDDGAGAYLRYAPVVGNAIALLGNRKDYSDVNRFEAMTANPRTVRFSPIGSYITPNLVSPSELSTPISNQMNAERNYIRNNSVGNSTAANNYALASDYLGNSRIGAAYLQGKQYNSGQRQRASAYNLGIDQYNSEGAFKEQQTNMSLNDYYLNRALQSYQMRNNIDMAYNQARSSNLTSMFNNLGNIGLDTFNRNRSNQVYPYRNSGWLGDILYNG